jgi:large subunit ribosomal protein L35
VNKIKTKKIITKRFKITKTGKVLRRKAFARHLNAKKSAKRKTNLRRVTQANKVQSRKIRKALGI